MTDSPVDHGGSADNRPEQQPLTRIEGIGETKQRWLESIGIETLQDLANADPANLESQLETAGHPTSRSVISGWIARAQQLLQSVDQQVLEIGEATESEMSEDSLESAPEAEESWPETTSESSVTSDIAAETAEASHEKADEWETFASFAVEFEVRRIANEIHYQTSVRHLETDTFQIWTGIEEERLQAWLREQLASSIPITASTPAVPPTSDTWLTPIIEDLRIYQPPSTGLPMGLYRPSLMFPSPVKSNLPFILEIQFSVQENDVFSEIRQEISYQAECYARSLKTGEALSLGKIPSTLFTDRVDTHNIRFPTMNLQSGIFRLQVLLNLQGMNAFPAYFEVPALQVN